MAERHSGRPRRVDFEGVVGLLLQRKDLNPNTPDTKYGGTPLMWAAMGGHEGIVKLLLEREDLNPYIPGLSGETALGLATSQGHARVMRLLSQPRLFLPAPINTQDADNMRRMILSQEITLHSNNKRTIPPEDEGKPRKKHRAFFT